MRKTSETNDISLPEATITVLGLGHVGLPTALGFAELGRNVIGADSDASKVAQIQTGQLPFYEPGLGDLLLKHLENGKFKPLGDADEAVRTAQIIFICVGTPHQDSGQADLTQVEAAARLIARNLNGYKLIVEKSTVPAITAQWLKKTILRYSNGGAASPAATDTSAAASFDVASNPEFLQEGIAMDSLFRPNRVICGVESDRAREILTELYRPLECPVVVTNPSTAELIKHAANAFLSTKISFINMVADLCEKVGADVKAVARGIGLDPRIGPDFLEAGIGYGGYCFSKDLRAFIYLAEEHGVDFALLKEVERINQQRVDSFVRKVRQALWVLPGKTIGILGLAFKPNTDDIRESVSLKIARRLVEEGCLLQLYDPRAMPNSLSVIPAEPGRVTYCRSAFEAACGAHAVLLLTEWEEFRQLDLVQMCDLMEVPILIDGRNIYDPESARKAGFEFISVGRDGAMTTAVRDFAGKVVV